MAKILNLTLNLEILQRGKNCQRLQDLRQP